MDEEMRAVTVERGGRWMEGCYKFLSDRSKPKLLVYNVMQVALAPSLCPFHVSQGADSQGTPLLDPARFLSSTPCLAPDLCAAAALDPERLLTMMRCRLVSRPGVRPAKSNARAPVRGHTELDGALILQQAPQLYHD